MTNDIALQNTDDEVEDLDEVNEVISSAYTITAYGADYPVDGLVKRLGQGDIVVPLFSMQAEAGQTTVGFQREFVWTKPQCDRFIESLLLGLPVTGIFLVKEASGKHLVLDGQQRLRTLQYFYDGIMQGKAFLLENVQERWRGKTYKTLEPDDRRRLDDSIIHATIVRQDEPSDDQSSVYLIFERLNSGGTFLQPQEIRVALYHGRFASLLSSLNTNDAWRGLYGQKSARLKDLQSTPLTRSRSRARDACHQGTTSHPEGLHRIKMPESRFGTRRMWRLANVRNASMATGVSSPT